MDVIGDKQVDVAVAIVVNESASGAPPLLLTPQSRASRYVREGSVAIVSIKNILAKVRTENVVEAVVVVIANANPRSPTLMVKTRFFRDISERSVAIVLIQSVGGAFGSTLEPGATEDKNVHPPVIVVVNEGATATRRLQNVFFGVHASVDYRLA